ncbi:uncharacterized protein LOC121393517 [Xenopus laevis]|uniref:Uncharacterized protein LOC108716100 n=1 Tax=Xenopus laevis TaxID=8355 RepID=A0A8J1KPX7_XENLA|nr:uncharacterized protein LOC108716100 [Xenopus laevis]XP_041418285.1 uncharacterized protein LOC121393517 [Xenopus laevis]
MGLLRGFYTMYSTMSQTSDPCTFLLQERDIKEHIETLNYVTEGFNYIKLSLPVCPVSVEKAGYVEDVECGNTLFVQEEIRPVPLLIPTDIRCDGLRCPIPPIEGQLTNREPELSSAIIQEFQLIVPYIETLISDTENGTSVKGIILGFLLPEIFAFLLEFCYGHWSSRKKAEKEKDEAPSEREKEGPQRPALTHDNMEEEFGGTKKKKKQRHSETHDHQGSEKPKSSERITAEEETELKQLLQQFICQCLEGDF